MRIAIDPTIYNRPVYHFASAMVYAVPAVVLASAQAHGIDITGAVSTVMCVVNAGIVLTCLAILGGLGVSLRACLRFNFSALTLSLRSQELKVSKAGTLVWMLTALFWTVLAHDFGLSATASNLQLVNIVLGMTIYGAVAVIFDVANYRVLRIAQQH